MDLCRGSANYIIHSYLSNTVLGSIIADGINDKLVKHYKISAVYDRQQFQAEKLAERLGVKRALSLEEIIAYKPAYVIEAASQEVVESMACDILKAGIDMIILSVGHWRMAD